jgi:hypothetical protein
MGNEKQLPVNYDEQLAKMAAQLQDKLSPIRGVKITVAQNKMFNFPDGTQTPGPFHAVIVNFLSGNFFFKGRFDAQNITPPACFAIGPEPLKLAPSRNAPEPQSPECNSCPNNQFGSEGKGKACKNQRLLAVLVVPEGGEITTETPLWTLALSPTALKSFDSYALKVARMYNATPVKVVSHIGFDPNVDFPSIRFGQPRPNEWLPECMSRITEGFELLSAEPDVSQFNKTMTVAPSRNAAIPRAPVKGAFMRRPT